MFTINAQFEVTENSFLKTNGIYNKFPTLKILEKWEIRNYKISREGTLFTIMYPRGSRALRGETTVSVRNGRVFSGIYFNQTTQVNQFIA